MANIFVDVASAENGSASSLMGKLGSGASCLPLGVDEESSASAAVVASPPDGLVVGASFSRGSFPCAWTMDSHDLLASLSEAIFSIPVAEFFALVRSSPIIFRRGLFAFAW
eukprot:CAMPEP_0178993824 /NCGR_PEP_ID=MMETSP0795-20121207/6925_1 /TAXON_ID=88552 /ORGANISM="Amoebophrya sp., Strain Ameob2" /LENGTH=110 /DNA_ID=CAMNT_0020685941 /DNA_START=1255 /DNA_END=1584 /DNA_ORIENTATION=-